MAYHPAEDKYILRYAGPFAIVRACRLCNFKHVRKSGKGRGSGMREGNKQRGILIQHVKNEHPTEYAEAMRAYADGHRPKEWPSH